MSDLDLACCQRRDDSMSDLQDLEAGQRRGGRLPRRHAPDQRHDVFWSPPQGLLENSRPALSPGPCAYTFRRGPAERANNVAKKPSLDSSDDVVALERRPQVPKRIALPLGMMRGGESPRDLAAVRPPGDSHMSEPEPEGTIVSLDGDYREVTEAGSSQQGITFALGDDVFRLEDEPRVDAVVSAATSALVSALAASKERNGGRGPRKLRPVTFDAEATVEVVSAETYGRSLTNEYSVDSGGGAWQREDCEEWRQLSLVSQSSTGTVGGAATRIQATFRGHSVRRQSTAELPILGGKLGLSGFNIGQPVALCGMQIPTLNCMEGVVVRKDTAHRYTVRVSAIGDTIALPMSNIQAIDTEHADPGDGDSDSDASSSSRMATRKSTFVEVLETARNRTMTLLTGVEHAVEHVKAAGDLATPLLSAWWAEKKHRAKRQLLELSSPMRVQMLSSVGELIKELSMRDPDMWPWIRPMILKTVSGLWEDISQEIEFNLNRSVQDRRAVEDIEADLRSTPGPGPTTRCTRLSKFYLRARAFVLHHYLPYNKTFFGKVQDKWYLLMVVFTLLPFYGVRNFFFMCLLTMLLFPGPPDEFQLTNFILLFKGTQFFTSGVIALFTGAMQYYKCFIFSLDDLKTCVHSRGPGAAESVWGQLLDYTGSVVLVWIAFLSLPRSRTLRVLGNDLTPAAQPADDIVYCFCCRGVRGRGGRLRRLLRYDVCCFIASFLVVAAMHIGAPELTQNDLRAALYWCRVVYALLSLPFSLFVLPVFQQLLTHCIVTGFNEHGACVEFAFRTVKPRDV
eukprot:TRINITY_DN29138_c0_g1_i2.p1 TRINITY_DN29138_c0_g1~~TRINITY_DN29138_c0_g1_i2.p1  ORF type:complete len:795 (-),score=140.13 TRINITY_DN29138_c0_g1_i2:153-2537(-)